MTTKIPLTELNQILQTKSSPETIAALLNEAEEKYSDTPKHLNAKRVYPYWKICKICLQPFQCHNHTQAKRNTICSKECLGKHSSLVRKSSVKPPSEKAGLVLVTCAVCQKQVYKPRSWLKKIKEPTCSRQCNGKLRGKEWAKHAPKGRSGWTAESAKSYAKKMTGANNPAWKGGVTYFRKHGNYAGVKYVRCPADYISMARKDGYVMEHRLLVAQAIGRPLLRSEVVHHVNHDPTDNRLENLQLFASNSEHKLFEHHGSPDPIWQL